MAGIKEVSLHQRRPRQTSEERGKSSLEIGAGSMILKHDVADRKRLVRSILASVREKLWREKCMNAVNLIAKVFHEIFLVCVDLFPKPRKATAESGCRGRKKGSWSVGQMGSQNEVLY